jgi:hypothetical protein
MPRFTLLFSVSPALPGFKHLAACHAVHLDFNGNPGDACFSWHSGVASCDHFVHRTHSFGVQTVSDVRKRTDGAEVDCYGLCVPSRRFAMHKYRVVDRCAEESRLTLQCDAGHYHLTRALSVFPPADATLEGAKPHLGFDLLLCPKSGAVFRVIFESIGNAEIPHAPTSMPGTVHISHCANRGQFRGAA